MDAGNVSAIISAVAGITGVLLGNAFVWAKEWGTTRQKDKRAISYARILLISHLDRFATECLEVARGDGTRQGQPAGEGANGKPSQLYRPSIRLISTSTGNRFQRI